MKEWTRTWVGNIREYSKEIKENHINAFAGQSAFFLFLSIFPLLNLLLMLTPLLPYSQQEIVGFISKIFPENLSGFVHSMIEDIFSNGRASLTIVTFITGLWSAAKGVMAIRDGLNKIYTAREERNFIVVRLIAVIYTAVFLAVIILVAVVSLFGRQIGESIMENESIPVFFGRLLIDLRGVVSFILIFLFMLAMYTMMPRRPLLARFQAPGALFAATAWSVLSWGFSLYINYSMKKSYMYGSLTTIIMLMLWLVIVVNIIFLGAQLNVFLYLYVWTKKMNERTAKRVEHVEQRNAHWRAWWHDVMPWNRLKEKKRKVEMTGEEKAGTEEKGEEETGEEIKKDK